MNFTVATVAVDNTFFSFDTDYSYIVPDDLRENAQIGARVRVPFGKSNKLRDGIIVSLNQADNCDKLKPIDSVAEKALTDELVKLALWLKERCFCTTYDCLKQMLPRRFGNIKSKSQRMVRLICDDESILSSLTVKQKSVCSLLLDVGTAGANEICEFCGVGIGVLKNLEKNNVIEFYDKVILRNPYSDVQSPCDKNEIKLSKIQSKAYEKLKKIQKSSGGNALLYGVTGSGKTQVYLKLIDDAIADGKDVIVMVPEISLTPQTLDIFHKRYGDIVAVFHSALSLGERAFCRQHRCQEVTHMR